MQSRGTDRLVCWDRGGAQKDRGCAHMCLYHPTEWVGVSWEVYLFICREFLRSCDLSQWYQTRSKQDGGCEEEARPDKSEWFKILFGNDEPLGKVYPTADWERQTPVWTPVKNCWMWGIEQAKAFQDLKDAQLSPSVLTMYDPNREGTVLADSSSFGLGEVLLQKWDKEWGHIVALSSTNWEDIQYRQVEKEALGLNWTCESFHNCLIGKHFQLETDHKPLSHESPGVLSTGCSTSSNQRQRRGNGEPTCEHCLSGGAEGPAADGQCAQT